MLSSHTRQLHTHLGSGGENQGLAWSELKVGTEHREAPSPDWGLSLSPHLCHKSAA